MICILTEKPSAARNFAVALGGKKGSYNGEYFEIVNARGHLFGLSKEMEDQVGSVQAEAYKEWNLSNLPWDENDFSWKMEKLPDTTDLIRNIFAAFGRADEVVIATDNDASGEGELLAWEILSAYGYKGKVTRMYFVDETPKRIQEAFVDRKTLSSNREEDGDFVKAWARTRFDFLSMQYTRMSTVLARKAGIPNALIRQGRLKSVMVYLVGEQEKAWRDYVKKPFFEARYKDENGNLYKDEKAEKFSTKTEVSLARLNPSEVVVDSKEKKRKPPEKLLDLAGLSSILASKGYRAKEVLETYQKMYEAHIVSYPRTDDKTITEEQFNELLPLVERIADVVLVDARMLTHRFPRKTHVKEGGAHGANRPGTNVPSSLDQLRSEYGDLGASIYETLGKNYLAMLAEDYIYWQEKGHIKDHPEFKGMSNIPIRNGYRDIFSDTPKTEGSELSSNGLGSHAESFIYEGVNPRPTKPNMKWLTKKLEQYNVGTGATRTSTIADITKADGRNARMRQQLMKEHRGNLSLTDIGTASYEMLKGTQIGNALVTEKLFEQMDEVGKFKRSPNDILASVKTLIRSDLPVMTENAKHLSKAERVSGIVNGEQVSFKKTWGGHTFTESEIEKLLRGEEISFTGKTKEGKNFQASGTLEKQTYQGRSFWGFKMKEGDKPQPDKTKIGKEGNPDRVNGTYAPTGETVTFKKIWGGHTFTENEVKNLLAGEEISFQATSKAGNTYTAKGKLEKQKYQGREYWGFKAKFD